MRAADSFDGLDVAATDDKSIDLFVFTEREGALGAVGHDLKLRVGELTLNRDGDQVLVSVKADSLRVEACIVQGDEKPVSLVDRKVIERNLAKDVLETRRHPRVEFRGTVVGADTDAPEVRGTLQLKGVERPLTIRFKRDGDGWRGGVSLDQRTWEIRPYTTFLGALKIKPEVRIEVCGPSGLF